IERGYAFAYLTLGFERAGEYKRAAACHAELLPYRGLNEEILVDFALGVSSACGGDIQQAMHHFETAEELARACELLPQLILTVTWQAGLDPRRQTAFEEAQ